MKFQIVLATLLVSIQVFVSKKFLPPPYPVKTTQAVFMNNNANSNSDAVAVKVGLFGDANAMSYAQGSNFNMVNQSS
jgi:hypothetical protein